MSVIMSGTTDYHLRAKFYPIAVAEHMLAELNKLADAVGYAVPAGL